MTKSNNTIKTTLNYIKRETGKIFSVKQISSLLVNDEKLQDPTNMINAFNKFFVTISEKLNIQP
jgi:hypothetical protein